ncbi:MAG TPA: hypothetical protein PLY56_05750 [Armatimonadota bacterium]|jgi:hypothetical protein|nr:hypothetical protein [Armatimonadota bacterium]HOJ21017.1 hypothetical protein [Armatimonadota bacterium]HOM80356.1 hypothetical protein [Armatimonadota bacterium]HOQ27984.1 hypothetical protein [Armatimonadota bacterium]HPO74180.1 hypothetical protein [Armatimonadota bacterium]
MEEQQSRRLLLWGTLLLLNGLVIAGYGLWQYVQANPGTPAWVGAWTGLIAGHLLAIAGILTALYYFIRRVV